MQPTDRPDANVFRAATAPCGCSTRCATMPKTLRAYAEQLPTVLSVPNLAQALRDAATEIERLRGYVSVIASGAPREDLLAIEREFSDAN